MERSTHTPLDAVTRPVESEWTILESGPTVWYAMDKMVNPPAQNELPQKVLDHLDAGLAKLYSQLPAGISLRIVSLVNKALLHSIHPNRLVKYAFLYVKAERQTHDDAVSKDHVVRAKHELAGEIHGLSTGYQDQAEAKRRYRLGRRACQQIQASLSSLIRKWDGFAQVVQMHRSELPLHLQSRFTNLTLHNLGKEFHSMAIALVLDEAGLTEKDRERERSQIAQTYIWWRLAMPQYRGKWNDMHQLAYTWKMSASDSVTEFRTVVNRICKGATCTYPFGEAWKSVLSKD